MKLQTTKRVKDSLIMAFEVLGGIATVLTILGISVATWLPMKESHWFLRILTYAGFVIVIYGVLFAVIYMIKGRKYQSSITLQIGKNMVTVTSGDIFVTPGWRVIPMDTTFSTVVDDKVISKNSLHGQLVLGHGDAVSIGATVEKAAKEKKISSDDSGTYRFPLGTVIPYVSSKEKDQIYLMVALTELNDSFEARTTMTQFEHTLMEMWKGINRVYASYDVVLPLLGSGITRFDDDQDDPANLLRCMLCTLNISKVHLN